MARASRRRSRRARCRFVIVGGGIAGLSAAWRLQKRGAEFVVLEMEETAGGNARSGRNDATAFPWAAHYVPVPGPRADAGSRAVRRPWRSPRRRLGRAAPVPGAAGAAVPPRPMAGGTRSAGRTLGTRSGSVRSIRCDRRGRARNRAVHDSDGARREAVAAGRQEHGRMADASSGSTRHGCAGRSTTRAATTTARAPRSPRRGPACTTSPAVSATRPARSPGPRAMGGSPLACSSGSAGSSRPARSSTGSRDPDVAGRC